MDHPRSKLPAILAVLFCIVLLAGVGFLLWKTLPEKQPKQVESLQTDGVFASDQPAVEPDREDPYEGELPEGAQAAEQPDVTTPEEPTPDTPAQEEPSPAPASDAEQKAQTVLASMTQDEKLWQLFFVTPEALTNVNTATVAGETTKNAVPDEQV